MVVVVLVRVFFVPNSASAVRYAPLRVEPLSAGWTIRRTGSRGSTNFVRENSNTLGTLEHIHLHPLTLPVRHPHPIETAIADAIARAESAGADFGTRAVRVRAGAAADTGRTIAGVGAFSTVAVIGDENTDAVAGTVVRHSLTAAGLRHSTWLCPALEGRKRPRCDDATIALADRFTSTARPDHIVAVGSGTVLDVARMAAMHAGIGVSVVATAPSMNGFTSPIASVLSGGVKRTRKAIAPVAVIADLDILTAAPQRMIASGYGDLISKPVSTADWTLSHELFQTPADPAVIALVDAGAALSAGIHEQLASRDPDAIARLLGGLVFSGLGMQIAPPGSQMSGAEHLVSHYLDMIAGHPDFEHEADLHGCQVALGVLSALRIYERLSALHPAYDASRAFDSSLQFDSHKDLLSKHFKGLYPAVDSACRGNWADSGERARRRALYAARLDSTLARASSLLSDSATIEERLRLAGAPTRFSEIGVSRCLARDTLRYCANVRARFTVLHLVEDLGRTDILDEVADELA